MEKKFIKRFVICSLSIALIFMGIIILFDPFFHYHDAISPLKRVLEERDYQVAGTLDHFDYDAIVLGNSMAENFNNKWFDDAFGVKTVKAVRAGGSNSSLLFYLDRAYEKHNIRQVYYPVTMDMLSGDTAIDYKEEPYYYMLNKNPIDDIQYVLNKDVMFKKIPTMLAYSFVIDYDEGESYNWYSSKDFSVAAITSRYYPYDCFDETIDKSVDTDFLDDNVEMLAERIEAHPETEFFIIFPPVSILWWDNEYRTGALERTIYKYEFACSRLLEYDNVHLYATFTEEDIICDLSLYMDTVHYNQNISRVMVDQIREGINVITKDNFTEYSDIIRVLVKRFSNHDILDYYPDAVVMGE